MRVSEKVGNIGSGMVGPDNLGTSFPTLVIL